MGGRTWISASFILAFVISIRYAAGVLICDQPKAWQCYFDALGKASGVACDWSKVVPEYKTCVEKFIDGCHSMAQINWQTNIAKFNTSLHYMALDPTKRCTSRCKTESVKEQQAVDVCATASGGYDNLLATIAKEGPKGTNLTKECAAVTSIITCMDKAVTCEAANAYKQQKTVKYQPLEQYCVSQPPIITPAQEPYNFTILAIVLGVVGLIIGVNIILVLVFFYDRRQRILKKQSVRQEAPSISHTTYYHRPQPRF